MRGRSQRLRWSPPRCYDEYEHAFSNRKKLVRFRYGNRGRLEFGRTSRDFAGNKDRGYRQVWRGKGYRRVE
jgi:hypothetical protein